MAGTVTPRTRSEKVHERGNVGIYPIATNAPNAGILEHHKYCLPDGIYDIGYDSISADDDFYSLGVKDDSFTPAYGVEEYEIDVYSDHMYRGSIESMNVPLVRALLTTLLITRSSMSSRAYPTAPAMVKTQLRNQPF